MNGCAFPMATPESVLRDATPECLGMICKYYGIQPYGAHTDALMRKLREEDIALDRVVDRCRGLLDLDRSMREEEKALHMEIEQCAAQWSHEEVVDMMRRLALCKVRLRGYGWHACTLCEGPHMRSDLSIVRVWPKSVTIAYQTGVHMPLHLRLKPSQGGFQDKAEKFYLSVTHVRDMADLLRAFHDAMRVTVPMVPDLLDIVTAYVGLIMVKVDYGVVLDSD